MRKELNVPLADPQASAADFVISRLFKAPRQLVWNAWTDQALLARWFGPKGTATVVESFDLRPGGMVHSRMDTPDGHRLWARFLYREVVEPSRLVYVHGFADAAANPAPSPFGGPWPMELLTTVVFEDEGDATRMTLTWTPINASDEERAAFEASFTSMQGGWGGSFDQLDELLAAGD
ncbi:MAG: ATPase [Sphingomonas bacterium]|uniref:SRPBCC family protein n=1 Tax=Sphingomonas bacterium TaxID=1895847 RepID=UPI002613D621|nr:SRPBCC domain-containing protein [Sphingomonas bacterium]MDB5705595.1 ATPase [Sphingomonas bacterium]